MTQDNRENNSRRAAALAAFVAALGWAGWRTFRRATADRELLPRGRALVTGASSGIGEAYARQLAAEGFDLTLVARREERLQALARELSGAHGIRAEVIAADLSTEEGIGRVAKAIEDMADLSLLINNAGFGTRGDFVEVDLERHMDMIRVHVIATITLTKAALPVMIGRGRGAIISVSSIAAFFPSGGGTTYTATKVYLNNFSEALAAELDSTGVKVQALCPGFTFSEFHDTRDFDDFDRQSIPNMLWMSADEVVAESLAALSGDRVIVIPGRQYRGIVASVHSPLRGAIYGTARRLRRRWHARRSRNA